MIEYTTPRFRTNKIASVLLKYKYKVKIKDILAGTIIGIEKKYILIDLGLNKAAFLPNDEIFINSIKNAIQILTTNQIGEFLIFYCNNITKKTIVSLRTLHYIRLWERFKQIDFKNIILFSSIEKSIKGGKLLKFDGLTIFLPNMHLSKYYRKKNKINKLLLIKILEVKDKQHTIIGSSKLMFLKKQIPSLQIGLIQLACVLSVKSFGIFLNIYGMKCLLHISEIPNKKFENPINFYKKGDQLKVKVIYINSSQGKIALSAKQI